MPLRRRHVLVPLLAALAAPAGTAHAQSSTGGAEAAPSPEVASASSGSVSVSTRAGALLKRTARVRGTVPAQDAGRTVTVERFDDLTSTWAPVAHAVVAEDGRFVARWKPDRVGPAQVRARVEAPGASSANAAPELAITVFRTGRATWYGPGFYGRRTACGQKLRRSTLGVAHKTLKCGTDITILSGGRTVTVPVIDRGPFHEGYSWDLTKATADAVGFEGAGTIGTLRATVAAGAGR